MRKMLEPYNKTSPGRGGFFAPWAKSGFGPIIPVVLGCFKIFNQLVTTKPAGHRVRSWGGKARFQLEPAMIVLRPTAESLLIQAYLRGNKIFPFAQAGENDLLISLRKLADKYGAVCFL